MIEASIVADSIAPSGIRLTTFVLKYPRFIHAELMTHRMFSRNASSSRAIPVKRQLEQVRDNPVMPLDFRANKKGMQAGDLLSPADQHAAKLIWEQASKQAAKASQALMELGVHKQYANRLLEPFLPISVIVTATDYDNWFGLRHHEMAQPEIAKLAEMMWTLYSTSEPDELQAGEWHLPFTNEEERTAAFQGFDDPIIKMSVARCARVSYNNHDGTTPSPEQDFALYERLVGTQPIHASPAEHQAMAIGDPNVRSGNFRGWIQYRQTLKGHTIKKFIGPGKFE